MKFEISFDFSEDNHYIEDNKKELGIKDVTSIHRPSYYEVELNTSEEFKELYEKLEKITEGNLSFIVTFDDPCIFISYD